MTHRLAFIAFYYVATLWTFVFHIMVTVRGWTEDGAWWGVGYLGFFIYTEAYFAYRYFLREGLSWFVVGCAFCVLWWGALLLGRKQLATWMGKLDDPQEDSEDART